MNKPTKKSGKVLPAAVMTILNVFVLGLAAIAISLPITSCNNGTTNEIPPDVARDVTIAEDSIAGYKVIVNCKPSQDGTKEKIATAISSIKEDAGPEWAYILNNSPITIIVDDTLTNNYEAKSKTSLVIKYSIANSTNPAEVKVRIEGGIAARDSFVEAALNNQFNNANKTIRIAHFGFQRLQRQT
jgi:hypothetical protein